ncbi:hypothetical protein AUR64_08030 [Haloprofundus marisrubri]|uniref:Uncharacterized protein n=1 Tax=Haloprofundus marisrubri TaxID=1514971 RepID=A0A0W1RBB9_9EURY|nr:hypothetical protein [Haloprofundus marisrubri]KTG10662.1 hypothetical protein AUR64_08030 [Haloprofundus marisrubri]
MSEITRKPALLSVSLSIVGAGICLVVAAVSSSTALAAAAIGVVVLGIGLVAGGRRAVTAGGVALFAAVVFGGLAGSGPELLLVGLLAAVFAWDVGENAIGIGEQLGRETDTARAELVHAASTLVVGVVATVLGYGAYRAAGGGQPVTALVFLLLGVVALVAALRD